MKFLVDENLPPALAVWIKSKGYGAVHIRGLGLQGQSDETILANARAHQRIIVTKDEDFERAQDVQVLRLRIGNTPTAALLSWLESRFAAALERCAAGAVIVLVD